MTPANRRRPADPEVFRHTATAQANRRRKAEAIVAAAVWLGSTDLEDLDDPDQRHAILAHAHLTDPSVPARASEETWAVARQVRAETRVHRLSPREIAQQVEAGDVVACGCTPHPVTGVLYSALIPLPGSGAPRSGWLCPHEDYRVPAPTQDPAVPALDGAGWDDGWDDGSEPDWAALAGTGWS